MPRPRPGALQVRHGRVRLGARGELSHRRPHSVVTMRHPFLALAIIALLSVAVRAQAFSPQRSGAGGRVNQLKGLSDKIDDVTTIENIVKSFVKPGMSDQERAKALWTAIVKYRHQTAPPNEYLAGDWEAHDPVKIFNVYGYCMCCCCSALVAALNRE